MTTTYTNTSRNSENIVACLFSGEGLLHACISSETVKSTTSNLTSKKGCNQFKRAQREINLPQ